MLYSITILALMQLTLAVPAALIPTKPHEVDATLSQEGPFNEMQDWPSTLETTLSCASLEGRTDSRSDVSMGWCYEIDRNKYDCNAYYAYSPGKKRYNICADPGTGNRCTTGFFDQCPEPGHEASAVACADQVDPTHTSLSGRKGEQCKNQALDTCETFYEAKPKPKLGKVLIKPCYVKTKGDKSICTCTSSYDAATCDMGDNDA